MARCSATLVALSLIAALLGCVPPHGTFSGKLTVKVSSRVASESPTGHDSRTRANQVSVHVMGQK